ncbi:MAG: hypothetical protein WCD79_22335 [Chthoniobacteraceae bacterium]
MAEATDSSSKILWQSTAVRFGIALLLGYGLITGFAVWDKQHLSSIEKASAPTAVGDTAFFPVAASFDPSTPLANFDGHSLYFVDWRSSQDELMLRVGMDDTNSFSIYKLDGAKGDEASAFFLKIKPSYYIKAKR